MRAQPGLKFVARHGDPWGLRSSLAFRSMSVRSLGSFALARSAPVVEVDAKVGVLSREKGVPGVCLAALPVLPVIPNFLARHTRFPLLEDDATESARRLRRRRRRYLLLLLGCLERPGLFASGCRAETLIESSEEKLANQSPPLEKNAGRSLLFSLSFSLSVPCRDTRGSRRVVAFSVASECTKRLSIAECI